MRKRLPKIGDHKKEEDSRHSEGERLTEKAPAFKRLLGGGIKRVPMEVIKAKKKESGRKKGADRKGLQPQRQSLPSSSGNYR